MIVTGGDLGKRLVIDGREMTIGRGSLNDLCIPSNSVSRIHALIRVNGDDVVLHDNESTNGVYINDSKSPGPSSNTAT